MVKNASRAWGAHGATGNHIVRVRDAHPTALRFLDALDINQTTLAAVPIKPLGFARIVGDVRCKSLPYDEAHQRLIAVINHLVRDLVDRVTHKIAGADLVRLIAD